MVIDKIQKSIKDKNFYSSIVKKYQSNSDFKYLLEKMDLNNFDFARLSNFKNIIVKYWTSCSLCQAKEQDCQQENKGFQFNLEFKNSYLFLSLKKCLHKNNLDMLSQNYLHVDFPHKWLIKDLKNEIKDFHDKERNLLLGFYTTLLNNFSTDGVDKQWLVLTGNLGAGKTFLTAAFANQFILKTNQKVIFINAVTLFSKFMQREINFNLFVEKLKTVDLLIIDDFGGENRLTHFRDEFLLLIFQQRFNLGLSTIIISNFNYKDLKNSYTLTKTKMELIKVETFFSLFQKAARFLTLTKIFKE